ncbi:hypothetical protein D3C73_1416460 [compost metagenome]
MVRRVDKGGAGDVGQCDDEGIERVIFGHRIHVAIQCVEQRVGGHRQLRVLGDTTGKEGQCCTFDDVLNQRRGQVHTAITEPPCRAGATVMRFIGVNNHGFTG